MNGKIEVLVFCPGCCRTTSLYIDLTCDSSLELRKIRGQYVCDSCGAAYEVKTYVAPVIVSKNGVKIVSQKKTKENTVV